MSAATQTPAHPSDEAQDRPPFTADDCMGWCAVVFWLFICIAFGLGVFGGSVVLWHVDEDLRHALAAAVDRLQGLYWSWASITF